MCLEKKKSKKIETAKFASEQIQEIQEKVPEPQWKYYLTLSQEIQWKFERTEESKQGSC